MGFLLYLSFFSCIYLQGIVEQSHDVAACIGLHFFAHAHACILIVGLSALTVFQGDNATELNSKLSLTNKELLQYAAKTGESVKVKLNAPFQTVLAQHGVSLQLDCGPLLLETAEAEFGEVDTKLKTSASVRWSKVNINSAGQVSKCQYAKG